MSQILVVENDRIAAMQYKIALEARNHKVIITYDGEDCLRAYGKAFSAARSTATSHELNRLPYDTVIVDYKIPKIDGAQVALEILSFNPRQRILFATAYVSELMYNFQEISRLGRYVEVLPKPFAPGVLVDLVEDKKICEELNALGANVEAMLQAGATHDQLLTMLENIKRYGTNNHQQ